MTNSIFDIFRIDHLGKRIFSKIIFTFGSSCRHVRIFLSMGDTDFSALLGMGQNAIEDVDYLMNDIRYSADHGEYHLHSPYPGSGFYSDIVFFHVHGRLYQTVQA